jgi:predicted RNA binding protein YcfA (HicA-like mRNA interferase family)
MPNVDKLIEKMQNQPTGIRPEEAEKVLCAYGYHFGRQCGSHRQYINGTGEVLTNPNHNPLKRIYIDIILQRIGKK